MASMFEWFWGAPRRQATERERILESVRREEMFGKQMEERKEKQLQQLLNEKDARIRELEELTAEIKGQTTQISGQMEEQMEQLTKGMDTKLAQVSIQLDSGLENLTRQLTELTYRQNAQTGVDSQREEERQKQLKQSMDALAGRLEASRSELSDKIHSENVKSYRNVQALVEELLEKLEEKEQSKEHKKSARGLLRAVLVVGILNLLVMVGWILYEMGIFAYFL